MKHRLLFALIVAIVLTALSSFSWTDKTYNKAFQRLNFADNAVSDMLYQKSGQGSSDIIVIGLDDLSIPVWSRKSMAEALDLLNADPDNRPAVIGLDILYTGESVDPESDQLLVDAVAHAGNVVVASVAVVGNDYIEDDNGNFHVAERVVLGWEDPFPALAQVTGAGIINCMEDPDGIIRHAMLYAEDDSRGRVYSFARVIYELWCKANNIEPSAFPDVSSRGLFYLHFSADPGGYSDGFNFADLLNGNIPPDFYRNKIVLIGPYDVGMQDAYPTSLDHARLMYGIDIHANSIEAFRNGFFPREVKPVPQLIFLFVLLFCSALFFWKRHAVPSLLLWLGLLIAWLGLCKFCYLQGWILHVLWVPLSLSILFLSSVIWNYIRTGSEKRLIEETFGRYIDPSVKNALLKQGISSLELGGEVREIAVLFVDIRGFTSMSEVLEAQTVVEILNRYLTLATECIVSNNGTLDKFVGDCAMAIWNAPVPQEDPVYSACHAAMDMVDGSKALNEELLSRFGRTVSFGVGVNWGPAVIGNIGAPKRMDYTAIGDTVNTAARLEANAPGGEIYISRSVADQLGARGIVESLGSSIKLKGKADGFEVLRLVSLK
ncbi:MAG: adenylate/guanylate cyclase domain-containing protein [Oscillospiraceae bacterium]|nr:adenylate/guanylate cyclase domain-containing protein [Oscillospiraceae bacterium]